MTRQKSKDMITVAAMIAKDVKDSKVAARNFYNNILDIQFKEIGESEDGNIAELTNFAVTLANHVRFENDECIYDVIDHLLTIAKYMPMDGAGLDLSKIDYNSHEAFQLYGSITVLGAYSYKLNNEVRHLLHQDCKDEFTLDVFHTLNDISKKHFAA